MDLQSCLILILQILYVVTIISLIIVILYENRNPQKTVSWILVLLFLPIIGIILYFFFGENHRQIRKATKKMNKGLGGVQMPDINLLTNTELPYEQYAKLSNLLAKINYSTIIKGNSIEFFSDGKSKFERLFADIENAKEYIHVLYYRIADDKIGHQFSDLLIKKVKEGLKVRLLYDEVGCIKTRRSFFENMRKEGIEVDVCLPIRPPRMIRNSNYRNHRKIVVIDGHIGYVGGMNVADDYVDGVSWGTKGYWRDKHIRIEGEGVYGLQATFLIDWYYFHKKSLDPKGFFPKIKSMGNNPLQIISSGPIDIFESITSGFFAAVNSAKNSVYIQTPYFIPNEQIMKSLQIASLSGIDVCITIPGKSDNVFLDAAMFSYISQLLEANIKVYLYRAGFIHAKMMIIDNNLTIIGSANMDIRSFDIDFETCAYIYDETATSKAKDIYQDDLKDSELVIREQWNNRSLFQKLFQSIVNLFAPLL